MLTPQSQLLRFSRLSTETREGNAVTATSSARSDAKGRSVHTSAGTQACLGFVLQGTRTCMQVLCREQ